MKEELIFRKETRPNLINFPAEHQDHGRRRWFRIALRLRLRIVYSSVSVLNKKRWQKELTIPAFRKLLSKAFFKLINAFENVYRLTKGQQYELALQYKGHYRWKVLGTYFRLLSRTIFYTNVHYFG
jgi:hypothetical protein